MQITQSLYALAKALEYMNKPGMSEAARDGAIKLQAFEKVVRQALLNCSLDNHSGSDDLTCEFCNSCREVLKG
jgi:hypothetical protein